MVEECCRDSLSLELTEVGLTGLDEDVGHRATLTGFDILIGVAEGNSEPCRQQGPYRRLARPGNSDEYDSRSHYDTTSADR